MIRVPYISLALVLTIAACGSPAPVDDKAKNTAGLPTINSVAPSASGEPRGVTSPAKAAPAPTIAIPAALQGRWGLSPADCMMALSNAKGLLVINANELRFYESRAVPAKGVEAGPASMSGSFLFTGEGRSWTKYEALKLDKQVLTRTETNPSASFSYAKCS